MVIFLFLSLANRKNMDLLNDEQNGCASIHSHSICINLNYNNNNECQISLVNDESIFDLCFLKWERGREREMEAHSNWNWTELSVYQMPSVITWWSLDFMFIELHNVCKCFSSVHIPFFLVKYTNIIIIPIHIYLHWMRN